MLINKFSVSVPATSANIGAGFDVMGIAFELYNDFIIGEQDTGELTIEGVDEEFQGEDNLVYQSMLEVFKRTGYKPRGIFISEENDIPIGKGLGSSATCIVAGLVGANAICGFPFSKQRLFEIAVEMEGHPDNVAPAFFGGLTISMVSSEGPITGVIPVKGDIDFYAFIPDFPLPTQEARAILPESYSREDVVYSTSHALLTMFAMQEGIPNILSYSIGDRIHEPYRKGLIPHFDELIETARESGALACYLSGAGPTVIAITDSNAVEFDEKMREFMSQEVFLGWEMIPLKVQKNGFIFERVQ